MLLMLRRRSERRSLAWMLFFWFFCRRLPISFMFSFPDLGSIYDVFSNLTRAISATLISSSVQGHGTSHKGNSFKDQTQLTSHQVRQKRKMGDAYLIEERKGND